MSTTQTPKKSASCSTHNAWSFTTPQARELAQHGRNRIRRAAQAVPGQTHCRQTHPLARDRRMGAATQRLRRPHHLALRPRQSQNEAGPKLPKPHPVPPSYVPWCEAA
jgi:hypothetical protein